jgi:hypothetical protein
MVLLTIYKDSNDTFLNRSRKGIFESKIETLEEAIQIGQKSGLYYEVFDTKSCRVIDWNEVNIKVEDDWYYDESEMIWKKRPGEESLEEPQNSLLNRLFNFNDDKYLCQLSY